MEEFDIREATPKDAEKIITYLAFLQKFWKFDWLTHNGLLFSTLF